jgi:hypothetical protein
MDTTHTWVTAYLRRSADAAYRLKVHALCRGATFDEYFAARAPALRRVAFTIVGDWHAADFTDLSVRWHRVRVETREAYVRKAVVNTALTLVKKRAREVAVAHLPDQAVTDPARELDAARFLMALPPGGWPR